ncbi:hypothetical protein [Clostridium botulinum]|uniref:hypothetical protein n=1 Tax=Clostridium botulinum TaxID=1491 RepID=UPI000A50024C|nr:hypothetical protein [Clostridium botulinum]
MSNNSNNQNNSKGGSILKNPSPLQESRNGIECAPSPTYRRPDRPGSGGNNSK